MTGDDLIRGLGHIPEEMIHESMEDHRRAAPWLRMVAAAVALALLVPLALQHLGLVRQESAMDNYYSNGSGVAQEAPQENLPETQIIWNPGRIQPEVLPDAPWASWQVIRQQMDLEPEFGSIGLSGVTFLPEDTQPSQIGGRQVWLMEAGLFRLGWMVRQEGDGWCVTIAFSNALEEDVFLKKLEELLTE